jgi:hypothetical protein
MDTRLREEWGMSKKFCGLSFLFFIVAVCVFSVRHLTNESAAGVPLASLSVDEIEEYAIQAGLDRLALLNLSTKSDNDSQSFSREVVKLAEIESKKRAYVKARARNTLKRRGVKVWVEVVAQSIEFIPYAVAFAVPTSAPTVSYSEARFRQFAGLEPPEVVFNENGEIIQLKK